MGCKVFSSRVKYICLFVILFLGMFLLWYETSYPGCIFLGIDEQKKLGFQVTSHLPTNSYTRKIIGYLFAIQNGAQHIYDTDDDNHPSSGSINFYQQQFTSGLIYDDITDDVMNPYAHFGQPSIWPRGFPLERVGKPTNNTYKLCTFKTPAIQQGLVNGDPDVDAIYRLTRKLPSEHYINVTFDARAPPVTLPEGVFAPFNSQNTFFTYEAFWALFLPTSVAFMVTDIWRGYWAQKLLWLLGQRLSFFPPNAIQFRNSHDYLEDFQDENQFYLQTSNLIDFLNKWNCSESNFFSCVSHLAHKMATASFWDKSDAELIDLWLADLVAIGYHQPKMDSITNECLKQSGGDETRRIYFRPVDQVDQNHESGLSDINHFCNNSFNTATIEMPNAKVRLKQAKIVFDDVLLIIVFNTPYYQNIRLLNALYYDHFPNIAYCGQTESYEKLIKEIDQGPFPWRKSQVTFININASKGYFAYECAIRAMEMRYDVNGFLVLADDIMFNFWNFEENHRLKVAQMQLQGYRTINRTSGPISKWPWWASPMGKIPLEKSLEELEILAENNTDEIQKTFISKYLDNRNYANLNMSIISLGVSDLYYIPKSVSGIFLKVMKVFLNNKVFLEIAVPTTIAALNPNVSQAGFVGNSVWGNDRNKLYTFFNAAKHYVHPVKLSQFFATDESRKEYCDIYVSQLFKNW